MISLPAPQVKTYTQLVFLTALLVIACTIAFNVVVDPYGMYHLRDASGFNQHKSAIYHRVRLSKAYDVRRIKPGTIILGTSRTHLGIRPSHPAWPENGLPVYNLAFDGATTKEMYYYLRHAQAVKPLKRVLLGLDTYHLTDAPGATRPDFDAHYLLQDNSWWSQIKLVLADLKILVSYDAFKDSIATIQSQNPAQPEWFAKDGQRLGKIFFRQPWENYQILGPRGYFDEIDKQEVRYKLEWRIPLSKSPSGKLSPEIQPDQITSLAYIKDIIEFCRAHNIGLTLYITPSHAHQLEIAAATGEWPIIENGKRALVQLLAADASKHQAKQAFPLYDFSQYSTVTSEALPQLGSRDEMHYYWESSHFKENVGDMVLNRIFNAGEVPEDFGVLLDSETVEKTLRNTRLQQKNYQISHPDDIARIQHEITEYKKIHQIQD
ncbi:hypothetical protein [Sulfurirhabdus autotrophica]|uniref:Uncharacterized protein n=1 Tax=Sulfurirhabdus autotrophica TaxID=1706046 RepID=A0A4R3YDW3_9PROT|nr:hypothetical protein [Sulfurirhabdus autotrophica]TCV90246.1 hypothetical protein EDC63_101216 [Sulfurirhabdus autotrophica]